MADTSVIHSYHISMPFLFAPANNWEIAVAASLLSPELSESLDSVIHMSPPSCQCSRSLNLFSSSAALQLQAKCPSAGRFSSIFPWLGAHSRRQKFALSIRFAPFPASVWTMDVDGVSFVHLLVRRAAISPAGHADYRGRLLDARGEKRLFFSFCAFRA